MIIRRLVILVMFMLVVLGCGKTVSSEDIVYSNNEDLIVLKNNANKPFSGTVEHYDGNGVMEFELKVKKGKLLTDDLALELEEVCSDDFNYYYSIVQLISDETLVYFRSLKIPFSGKVKGSEEGCKYEFSYKDGRRHGETIIYYENGNILFKRNYKDGKKHGEYIAYYENGNLKYKINYKNGNKDGWDFEYDESGKPTSKERYENDVEVERVNLD